MCNLRAVNRSFGITWAVILSVFLSNHLIAKQNEPVGSVRMVDGNSCKLDLSTSQPRVVIIEISPGVWTHTSWYRYPNGSRFPSNGLIVKLADNTLMLVDTAWGELVTERLLDLIKADINLPVSCAVITHFHYDRSAGAAVVEAHGIPVYATPNTIKLTENLGMPVPDKTLEGLDDPGSAIKLKGVEIFYPGPAHSTDNLVVWVPESHVLFGGCMVRDGAAKSIGNLYSADKKAWPGSLKRVIDRYKTASIVVPGHGTTGGIELLQHTDDLLTSGTK